MHLKCLTVHITVSEKHLGSIKIKMMTSGLQQDDAILTKSDVQSWNVDSVMQNFNFTYLKWNVCECITRFRIFITDYFGTFACLFGNIVVFKWSPSWPFCLDPGSNTVKNRRWEQKQVMEMKRVIKEKWEALSKFILWIWLGWNQLLSLPISALRQTDDSLIERHIPDSRSQAQGEISLEEIKAF